MAQMVLGGLVRGLLGKLGECFGSGCPARCAAPQAWQYGIGEFGARLGFQAAAVVRGCDPGVAQAEQALFVV